jgi:hypothetical protein
MLEEFVDDLTHRAGIDSLTSRAEDQCRSRAIIDQSRPTLGHIRVQGLLSRNPVGDDPLLAPLTQHAHRASRIVYIVEIEAHKFAYPHARRVEKFDDTAISNMDRIAVIGGHNRHRH